MQDATVQSTQPTSQAPVAVAPSSYVAAAPAAPVAAPQAPVQQAPVQQQVVTSYPQAVQAPPTSSQSSPSQFVPPSQPVEQANPWESAFNKVVGLLSSPAPSPFQGQPSTPTQAAPQAIPANWAQAESISPGISQSAPLTWSPNQASSPNYSQTYSQPSPDNLFGQEAAEAHQTVDQAIADYYNLSEQSRQVIDAFGVEAPGILNQYALNLEAMLDQAVVWGHDAAGALHAYAEFAVNEHVENKAFNEILTNPDVLSDYTLKFFGPEGPYPVYESEGELETRGYPTQAQVAPGLQPQMPAPPQQAAPTNSRQFWGTFSDQMTRDPANAWRTLSQAQPNVLANKLFVAE